MPRVLPILSRPSNLLRRRKNIHWSPLSRRDATFPVPRRVTNSTVFNPKCATGPLAYCFSVDYLAPRSPPFPGDAPPILSATEGGGRGLGGRWPRRDPRRAWLAILRPSPPRFTAITASRAPSTRRIPPLAVGVAWESTRSPDSATPLVLSYWAVSWKKKYGTRDEDERKETGDGKVLFWKKIASPPPVHRTVASTRETLGWIDARRRNIVNCSLHSSYVSV